MNFLNFFSLVLLFVWQVSAGKCTGNRKNANGKGYSSKSNDDSNHQQKLTKESKSPNIVPDKSFESQYSSDAKNDHSSKLRPLMLQNSTSQSSKVDIKHESNSTKPKLELIDTNEKTAAPIENEPLISSEENTPKEKNLNDVLEQIAGTPPIQDLFFKHFTNIYSFDRKTKTLILNGDNSSEGFSWEVYVLRVCYSKLSIKTLIFKNLAIGRIIFETIMYFLSCYRNTLEMLIFDHCFFSSNFAVQNYSNLDKLHTAKITYCALDSEILKKTLSLFPSSLQTLELSHLCFNRLIDDYEYYGEYLILDLLDLNISRFSMLKNLYVKRNDIINFKVENFTNLEEIEANDKICKLFALNTTELKKMGKLKKISNERYIFTSCLDYFVERNITVDNHAPVIIYHSDLSNIYKILSTYTNVWFSLKSFTSDDIGFIPLDNESKFKHLESVTFSRFEGAENIAFMNCILNLFHSIRTISVDLSIENIIKEQIADSFNDAFYDNIENVHFTNLNSYNIFFTCEFIIQILKRVPNSKYLSFTQMKEDVIGVLFNRLQEEKLEFPNLKKIDIKIDDGLVNLLPWFIQAYPIEEFNIEEFKLLCSLNGALDNFSNKTLRKLCITRLHTDNYVFLKKIFDGMKNLRELQFEFKPELIMLFKDNSTIEKVVLKFYPFISKSSQLVFTILKTFKSLKCIYVKFREDTHSYAISAFKTHFKDSQVELIFYSQVGYFP